MDAEYLRNVEPKTGNVRIDVLDILESRAMHLLVNRASTPNIGRQKIRHVKYTIPQVIPGYPHIKPEKVIGPLLERLRKREGIEVNPLKTDEAYMIVLSWNAA